MSAIAACLESFVGKVIPNPARVSFGPKTSPKEGLIHWQDIVNIVSPFSQQLLDAISDGLRSNEKAKKAISTFRSLVQATVGANAEQYKKFAKNIYVS